MIKAIYKLEITVKYSFSDSYIISTDEYYLPDVKSCMGAVEAYTSTGTGIKVIVEKVDIKRMRVCDDATI